ncbi:MAG: cupin domain-containing protein [Nitriliruptorales bacterium]|nr:cupin domain-containing protein [Nitriliruptorales bacterium]
MGLIVFDEKDDDRLVAEQYSTGRGPVLRSDVMELTKITFEKGKGAELHQHPEEQILYVLDGVFEVTVGDERYEVHSGQASFHPSNVPHRAIAKERTVALSFKHLVDPNYAKSGDLT